MNIEWQQQVVIAYTIVIFLIGWLAGASAMIAFQNHVRKVKRNDYRRIHRPR